MTDKPQLWDGRVSLRSWRDSLAGERRRSRYHLAGFARDFASGEAASEIPACHILYGFCLPPTFNAFDESIK